VVSQESSKKHRNQPTFYLNNFSRHQHDYKSSLRQLAKALTSVANKYRKKIVKFLKTETKINELTILFKYLKTNCYNELQIDEFVDIYFQSVISVLFISKVIKNTGILFKAFKTQFVHFSLIIDLLLQNSPKKGAELQKRILFEETSIEEFMNLLNNFDFDAIKADFKKHNAETDFITYFYDQFLRIYNPQLKSRKGIFYTPLPIVSFIVRSTDLLLQKEFNCPTGLAHPTNLQILDPALGTGAFLEVVIQQIKTIFDKQYHTLKRTELQKKWQEYTSCYLLPKIRGIEILLPSFIIAYLKIGDLLQETGFKFSESDKLGISLQNTLEIRDISSSQPFTVIIGNPPYARSSANKGEFIESLMQSYKRAVRTEKNIQPLSDDYIKFIRWSQEVLTKSGKGIIGIVTNHTFLTGIVYRGMRQELMKVFDLIYILDLHGSKIIHENIPNRIEDENIFNIKQGVCIIFLLKTRKSKEKKIYHYDLFGSKKIKFDWLNKNDIYSISWTDISHIRPGDPFTPNTENLMKSKYQRFYKITDLFEFYNVGGKPGDDPLLVSFEPQEVYDKLKKFTEVIKQASPLGKLTEAKQKFIRNFKKFSIDKSKIEEYNYRPFDIRWTYYDPLIWTRAVKKLKNQCRNNLFLLCSRILKDKEFSHIFVSNLFTDVIFLSNTSSVNCYVFPLFRYNHNNEKIWNLSPLYLNYLKTMGIDLDNSDLLTPLAYIYAILYSKIYRKCFYEYLKRDFPRIPFIYDNNLFQYLIKAGECLINLHIHPPQIANLSGITTNIVEGDQIQRGFPKYQNQYVYINPHKWFFRIEKEVWDFQIGKYQVCRKWLKDRIGRLLSKEEILHYKSIIIRVRETLKIMKQIDSILEGFWFGKINQQSIRPRAITD